MASINCLVLLMIIIIAAATCVTYITYTHYVTYNNVLLVYWLIYSLQWSHMARTVNVFILQMRKQVWGGEVTLFVHCVIAWTSCSALGFRIVLFFMSVPFDVWRVGASFLLRGPVVIIYVGACDCKGQWTEKIAARETQMRTVGMAVTSFMFHKSIGLCQHFLRGKSQGSKDKEPQMNKRGHGARTPWRSERRDLCASKDSASHVFPGEFCCQWFLLQICCSAFFTFPAVEDFLVS